MAEKLFYSMGEVAEMFDVNKSLIRHWESQFAILRPKRNKKGNRLFSPADVENLKVIYHLVKERGMTLEGAKKALRKAPAASGVDRDTELMERLQRIRALLVEVREDLKSGAGEIVAGADFADDDPSAAEAGSATVVHESAAPSGAQAAVRSQTDAAQGSGEEPDEAPVRRRAKAVVKIDEATGEAIADAPTTDAAGQPAPKRAARKPRRKKEEVEHKELFAFYEQSLF